MEISSSFCNLFPISFLPLFTHVIASFLLSRGFPLWHRMIVIRRVRYRVIHQAKLELWPFSSPALSIKEWYAANILISGSHKNYSLAIFSFRQKTSSSEGENLSGSIEHHLHQPSFWPKSFTITIRKGNAVWMFVNLYQVFCIGKFLLLLMKIILNSLQPV